MQAKTQDIVQRVVKLIDLFKKLGTNFLFWDFLGLIILLQ